MPIRTVRQAPSSPVNQGQRALGQTRRPVEGETRSIRGSLGPEDRATLKKLDLQPFGAAARQRPVLETPTRCHMPSSRPPFVPDSPGADPEAWSRDPKEPDARRHPGRTLLMEAALANDLAAVRALLPVSDLHAEDGKGFTALHHACDSPMKGAEVVTTLLTAGANPHALCAASMTPIMYACKEADLSKVDALWAVSDLRHTSRAGHTLLVLAVWAEGGLPVVQRLTTVCDMDARSFDQQGLLHHVQDPEVMDWLLDQGLGDPRAVDDQGKTPLMQHVEYNRSALVERLLPVSDVLARDRKGDTALDKALGNRLWRIARRLAMAMPAGAALSVLQAPHRWQGVNVRRLEQAVIDAEQQALRAELNSSDGVPAVHRPRL